MSPIDPFGALSTFEKSDGSTASFMNLNALEGAGICKLDDLPFTIRILLESVLRNSDGFLIGEDDIRRIASWSPDMSPEEIPFSPSRVILQDFTGVPALVDIAALRDAMLELGGDPSRVNPQVPVDLVIDVVAVLTPVGDAFGHCLQTLNLRGVGRDRQAPLPQRPVGVVQ